jgi:hypothetical protein
MTDVNESVAVPQNSATVANALAAFTNALLAAKKAGASGASFIAAAGASLVDLEPCIAAIGGVGSEVGSEPLGVAEAFSIAGFQVARTQTGK